MDVHGYLVVFLRTETQRNKYLAVNITNGTASLLLHAAISYSLADSAMIKLVTIQWTGNCTPATYLSSTLFLLRKAYVLLMLVEFQGFLWNIKLLISN